jgi:hypothetical protein
VDVGPQVVSDVVGIVEELGEVERGDVPQVPDVGEFVEERPKVGDLALDMLVFLQHRRLHRLKDAVQPADHRHREDHPPILRLLVVAAQ